MLNKKFSVIIIIFIGIISIISIPFTIDFLLNSVPPTEKKYTFMFYLNGDNNLERDAVQYIYDLESVGSTLEINIVVQIDRHPEGDNRDGDWEDTRRGYMQSDEQFDSMIRHNINSKLSSIGEKNMGSGLVLYDFITWSQKYYPAENYVLVLMNHGSGVMGVSEQNGTLLPDEGGLCFDETSNNDYLTYGEINYAIKDKEIKLLLFEACLMASSEFYYALSNNVEYFIGGESVIDCYSFPHDDILNYLDNNINSSIIDFGEYILYQQQIHDSDTNAATFSFVNASKLNNIISTTSNLALKLYQNISSYKSAINSALLNTLKYQNIYLDLYNFTYNIQQEIPSLEDQTNAVMHAINQSVIDFTIDTYTDETGHSVFGSHGISIYFPNIIYGSQHVVDNLQIYSELPWCLDSYWDEFLTAYFS